MSSATAVNLVAFRTLRRTCSRLHIGHRSILKSEYVFAFADQAQRHGKAGLNAGQYVEISAVLRFLAPPSVFL